MHQSRAFPRCRNVPIAPWKIRRQRQHNRSAPLPAAIASATPARALTRYDTPAFVRPSNRWPQRIEPLHTGGVYGVRATSCRTGGTDRSGIYSLHKDVGIEEALAETPGVRVRPGTETRRLLEQAIVTAIRRFSISSAAPTSALALTGAMEELSARPE